MCVLERSGLNEQALKGVGTGQVSVYVVAETHLVAWVPIFHEAVFS